jgi:hypothetical protein
MSGSLCGGGEKPIDPAVRTVDASVAYVGMWITFVEADFVVRAMLAAAAAAAAADADATRGCMTKRWGCLYTI